MKTKTLDIVATIGSALAILGLLIFAFMAREVAIMLAVCSTFIFISWSVVWTFIMQCEGRSIFDYFRKAPELRITADKLPSIPLSTVDRLQIISAGGGGGGLMEPVMPSVSEYYGPDEISGGTRLHSSTSLDPLPEILKSLYKRCDDQFNIKVERIKPSKSKKSKAKTKKTASKKATGKKRK